MTDEKLKAYFEEKYLKNSCFETLEELLNDKTLVQINAPRALIACELCGVWKGLNDNLERFEEGCIDANRDAIEEYAIENQEPIHDESRD